MERNVLWAFDYFYKSDMRVRAEWIIRIVTQTAKLLDMLTNVHNSIFLSFFNKMVLIRNTLDEHNLSHVIECCAKSKLLLLRCKRSKKKVLLRK